MERCQTCTVLQLFQSLGNWLWLCFICNFEFPVPVPLPLSVLLSLCMGCSIFVRLCVCVFPARCLCVCPVVSQLTEYVCMCDWLTEWNVSLISLLLLEGRRGGLYSVISASLWPPLSPRRTWEHTRRSYIEAFKHLILRLFHYNRKTFCFVFAFLLRTPLWNCGWRVTNGSVKSITKRAFDWLIDCDGLACGGVDQNNEHLYARSGYSKHNFSCKRPSVQNTCQELAVREIIARRVVLVDVSVSTVLTWTATMCVDVNKVSKIVLVGFSHFTLIRVSSVSVSILGRVPVW